MGPDGTNKNLLCQQFIKMFVEKFMAITLLLKESMILRRVQSIILYNKVAKINTYIYTHS